MEIIQNIYKIYTEIIQKLYRKYTEILKIYVFYTELDKIQYIVKFENIHFFNIQKH